MQEYMIQADVNICVSIFNNYMVIFCENVYNIIDDKHNYYTKAFYGMPKDELAIDEVMFSSNYHYRTLLGEYENISFTELFANKSFIFEFVLDARVPDCEIKYFRRFSIPNSTKSAAN